MGKFRLSHVGSALTSLIVPKTPRGRVRQVFVFVLLLFVFAGNLAEPKYWNAAADKLNASSPVKIPHFWNVPFRMGLDLQGGTHLVYTADMKSIPDTDQADAMSGVRDVIERRVNAFGVSEPLVQVDKSGSTWRLIVDLAGVKDISSAIKQIGETPILEFKEQNNDATANRTMTPEQQTKLNDSNALAEKKAADALAKALVSGADFGAIAKEMSDDANSKDNGGDLGFVTVTSPYKALADRVAQEKDLKPGTILPEVVKIDRSANVVKFIEKKEAGQEIQASHILICYKGAERCEQTRSKEEAKAMADDLLGKLNATNFASVATQKSDDKGSGAQGGDLGWFAKGMMVPAFDAAAFALKDGEMSQVVETPFGFHIIRRIAARPTYEYHLAHIMARLQTAEDILPPPEQWKNTNLSGKDLKRATLQFNQQTGEPQVGIEFNDNGTKLFADITERNVGKPVAIFLDGQVLSAPNVESAIREGKAVITGSFTIQEAKLLVRRMNAGALPVPITLETQTSVGASLGRESLDLSLKAGLVGFLMVAFFMLIYYRLPGLIAVLALLLYTAMNLSVIKLFPVTMTISGIAGFILSVGMAVDANVLIFERMKEELKRGRTLQSAIDEGFRRAWNSIRDSNFTTLISCAILYYTSSSLIKGFALTLALGVILSMFSAITVSRTLLRLVSGWSFLKAPALYMPGLHSMPEEKKE
jgi:protein-export membrane protein SecD